MNTHHSVGVVLHSVPLHVANRLQNDNCLDGKRLDMI